MYAIEARNLTKIYPKSGTPALCGITITCKKTTIFSLLGENRAGKTTTVKILCTVLLPTSGEAYVSGFNTVEEPENVREVIGYLLRSHTYLFSLTGLYGTISDSFLP